MEIHPSARKHGIADDDILHDHRTLDGRGRPRRRPLAHLLEVIVLVTAEVDELIIHAMPLRAIYRKLLNP